MGPNDIYARFAEKLNNNTWVKFRINNNPKTNWIIGSSYYEPSFCKHTYSQAENGSGRIISYTTRSNIENLLSGKLNENSYQNLININKNKKINRTLLKLEIESKGYSIKEISKKINISYKKINDYFKNTKKTIEKKYIIKLCKLINSDPNLFIDKTHKEDSVGKLYFDYKDSIKTIRKFKSYKVASIVNSKRFPDLSGYFIKVKNLKKNFLIDLFDSKCSHYFATRGKMKIYIKEKDKNLSKEIREGDCLWMSAFTHHGFTGNGSLLKISDGQNINYLEKEDLINTYDVNNILKRAKDDMQNWGYDK
jgi:2-hydroxyethylphosphonate dioxygenase